MSIDGFESRLFQTLHRRITDEITKITGGIAAGQAEDFAAYKSKAGRIQGLTDALRIAQDIEDDARGVKRGDDA